jgi:hypothetical protein
LRGENETKLQTKRESHQKQPRIDSAKAGKKEEKGERAHRIKSHPKAREAK